MKNSLWIIIALVTGIVGFLVGYSVSGFTGARGAQAAAQGAPAPHDGAPAGAGGAPAHKADAGGYAGASGTAHGPAAGGYGGASGTAHGAAAGGYGGAQPAQPPAQKVAAEKPKAAGY